MSVPAESIEQRISAAIAPEETEPVAEAAPVAESDVTSDLPEGAEEAPQVEATEEVSEQATEETTTEEATEDDAIAVEDIGQLAEHLGIDVSELYDLNVPITDADGKRHDVKLGEWKDNFQLNEQAAKAQRQAQEEYDALAKQRQDFEQQTQAAAAQTQRFIQAAQQELTQEFNAINWEALRTQDPGQYAVKRQDFIERNARLGKIEQDAANEWQQQQNQMTEQRQAQLGQYIQREQERLVDAVPEWRNNEAAQAEKSRVSEYLQKSGYTSEEIGQAYDHRAIVLARKAMLWDESQKKGDVAKKRVLKIGKRVLKPGSPTTKQDQRAEREAQLRKQLGGRNGSVDAAAELIANRLGR